MNATVLIRFSRFAAVLLAPFPMLALALPGQLQFATATQTVSEAAGEVQVTVRRVGGATGIVSVRYAAAFGDAVAGADYVPQNGVLTWADGDAADKTFTIPIINDTTREPVKRFNVNIANPIGGATLGVPRDGAIYIEDDDGPAGAFRLAAATHNVSEAAGEVRIVVQRVGGSSGAVSVRYAAALGNAEAGVDYAPQNGVLSWADGDVADKSFSVPLMDDRAQEPIERFNVALANPAGGAVLGSPRDAVVYIEDDDGPAGAFRFSSVSYRVHEGAGEAVVVVQRTGGTTGSVSVRYAAALGNATAGADYVPQNGVLSWGDGEAAEKSFRVPVIDDARSERTKRFNVSLANPVGGAVLGSPRESVVYIDDDDGPDSDGDGVSDVIDNCPTVANLSQADFDGDGVGDACDTPAGCPPIGSTVIADWNGFLEPGANVSGIDFGEPVPPVPQTEIVASDVDIARFDIPGGCGITNVSVEISWLNPAEDLDLYVEGLDGQPGGSSAFVLSPEIANIANPQGAYEAHVVGFNNLGTEYRGRITVTRKPGGSGGSLECEAAFSGGAAGATMAAVDPGIPFGVSARLVLSFAGAAERAAAAQHLREAGLLTAAERAQLLEFKHLPQIVLYAGTVTTALIENLRRELTAFRLVSIWSGERALKPLLDESVALIGVPEARDEFASPALPLTGAGIGVAVIDTGLDATHPDFPAERVKENVRLTGDPFFGLGIVPVPLPNTELTSNGHGTHLSGIIAGSGAASAGRFAGVAPGVDLIHLAVEYGSYIYSLAAMDYVLEIQDEYNIRVTNHSYGPVDPDSDPVTPGVQPHRFDPNDASSIAIKALYDAGIIAVFAAGNSGSDDDTMGPDAQNPCAIGVASGRKDRSLSDFSSRGQPASCDASGKNCKIAPDITAPGEDIVAARAANAVVSPVLGGNPLPEADAPFYINMSGTSMAAPHVAAAVAILLEAEPELNFQGVLDLLRESARPMPGYTEHEVGAGYLDVYRAAGKLLTGTLPPPPLPARPVVPGPGTTTVATFAQSYGPFTTSVLCSGCPTVDSEGGFATYLFKYDLPVGSAYQALQVDLHWRSETGALEHYRLEVVAPDGMHYAHMSGVDVAPDGLGSPPAVGDQQGATSLSVSVTSPPAGEYEIYVKANLNAGFAPFSVTVKTICPSTGCGLPDGDSDTVPDFVDNCPVHSNAGQEDADHDGVGDACDVAACTDGLDNDGDGWIDLDDSGCESSDDTNEADDWLTQCSNGVDDADPEDTLADSADPGCENGWDKDETNTPAACSNGLDDDGDGWIDLLDAGCASAADDDEADSGATQCSNGVDDADPEDALADEADPDCTSGFDNNETASDGGGTQTTYYFDRFDPLLGNSGNAMGLLFGLPLKTEAPVFDDPAVVHPSILGIPGQYNPFYNAAAWSTPAGHGGGDVTVTWWMTNPATGFGFLENVEIYMMCGETATASLAFTGPSGVGGLPTEYSATLTGVPACAANTGIIIDAAELAPTSADYLILYDSPDYPSRLTIFSGSAGPDSDGDGVVDAADNCPGVANPGQDNHYGTAAGDACEDTDGDGAADANDAFPLDATETADSDGDGTGNNADACPLDPTPDCSGGEMDFPPDGHAEVKAFYDGLKAAAQSGEPVSVPTVLIDTFLGFDAFGAASSVDLVVTESDMADGAWFEVNGIARPDLAPWYRIFEGQVPGEADSRAHIVIAKDFARGAVRRGDTVEVIRIRMNGNLPVDLASGAVPSQPSQTPPESPEPSACPADYIPFNEFLRAIPPYLSPDGLGVVGEAPELISRVILDADYDAFRRWGWHTPLMMVAILAEMDVTYRYEVGIHHKLVGVHLNLLPGYYLPVDDADQHAPFPEVSRWWDAHHAGERDIVHLFTGHTSSYAQANCIGSTGTRAGYSFTPIDWEEQYAVFHENAFAHEFGHLYSAHHHYGNHVESELATIMIQGYTPGAQPQFSSVSRLAIRGWAEEFLGGGNGGGG